MEKAGLRYRRADSNKMQNRHKFFVALEAGIW